MRILVLTPQVPRFPAPGGETRQFCLLRELAARHEFVVMPIAWIDDPRLVALRSLPVVVDPILLGRPALGLPRKGEIRAPLRQRVVRRFPEVAEAYRRVTDAWRGAACMVSSAPRGNAFTRRVRHAVRHKLEHARLNAFDLIQVEHMEAGHWLAGIPMRIPRILVCHNVNAVTARRELEMRGWGPNGLVARLEYRNVRTYETAMAEAFRNCVVVSKSDRDALRSLAPNARTWVVPNGVDTGYFRSYGSCETEGISLLFSGSMSWPPNVDAMVSFCTRILPQIRRVFPSVTLTILGVEPSAQVRALARQPGVTVTGWVEDARPYMARATVYVVPLRLGGGTRLKILEAMAMGKAVVSTSVGCEGLDVTPDKDILVADSPEKFSERVCHLIQDAGRRAKLGAAGRALVEERYDWRSLAREQDDVYAAVAALEVRE